MDQLLSRLRTALAGRYEVEHELGRGGMAVVFLGRDLKLERRVAIKVFERESAGGEGAERFLREIRIAAQLQHPNILPVFESGTAGPGDGGTELLFYVMPYVAGASLRERLEREGPLPIAEAVRIGREVALALDHAHAAGIVHRDIKPDNIMLSGGVAVVADFGIARALEQAGGGTLTGTGMALGTPNYMSPEQATAAPNVDGRADIYALGCVLYEMLAGTPPFSGPTAQAVMARHTADAVPPLRTVRPEVSEGLEAVVVKALAKLPVDRWATGREFAEVLAGAERPGLAGPQARVWLRVGIGVAALAALVVSGQSLRARRARPDPGTVLHSVAVLPFVADDSAHAALADGLTEAVSSGLVKVEGLGVLSSGSVQRYRDRATDARQAGRDLGVSAVVSARVRVSGDRLRVAAELTDVATGRAIWSQLFDGVLERSGQLQDVFTLLDSLTVRIVDGLRVPLAPGQRASLAGGARTRDPEAYRLYLDARHAMFQGSPSSMERAVVLFGQAIRRDSLYADAWVGLANATGFLTNRPPADVMVEARRAVDRGLELDSANGYAFVNRGHWRLTYDWDPDGAGRDMRRAIRLAPGSADVAWGYSGYLLMMGAHDSAVAYAKRWVALDPTNAAAWQQLGVRLAFAGMKDSALAATERGVALDSSQPWLYWVLMNGYLDAGQRAAADSAADHLWRLAGDPGDLAALATYYRRSGNRQGAQRVLDRIERLARTRYMSPSPIGVAYLAVGDRARALDLLEQAVRNREMDVQQDMMLNYTPLANEPRFQAAARRVFGGRPIPRNPFP